MSDIDREWEGSIRVRWVVVPPEGATVDRERVAEIVVSAVDLARLREEVSHGRGRVPKGGE